MNHILIWYQIFFYRLANYLMENTIPFHQFKCFKPKKTFNCYELLSPILQTDCNWEKDGSKKCLEAIKNNNQATKHIIIHIELTRAYILKYTNDLTTPHSIVRLSCILILVFFPKTYTLNYLKFSTRQNVLIWWNR